MDLARADRDVSARPDAHHDELRAALFGIENSARGLHRHRHRLTARQFDVQTDGLLDEVRRVRAMLDASTEVPGPFDLADAIAPSIASARAAGLDVRASLTRGIEVNGRSESAARVVLALLDNVRTHAAGSPVDVRATVLASGVELYVEDRGRGIAGRSRRRLFEREPRGQHDVGSGLFIARRLMAEQGGSIVYRARPGGGASFVLRFQRPSSRPIRSRRRSSPRTAALRDVSHLH